MVKMVVFWIFHPYPPPLCYVTMETRVPIKFRCNSETDTKNSPCDGLYGGLQVDNRETVDHFLDVFPHLGMANQVTFHKSVKMQYVKGIILCGVKSLL